MVVRRLLVSAVAVLSVLGGLTLAVGPASADSGPGPVWPLGDDDVTGDVLPTAQHNGVTWSQVIIGNTVYVGGQFTAGRPAGAAPGVGEVAFL